VPKVVQVDVSQDLGVGREVPLKHGVVRKHHQHGGHADRYAVLTEDALTYVMLNCHCPAGI